MPKYRMVALSCVMPGRQQEFEDWYDTQHIPDCMKLKGFVSAQRFTILDPPGPALVPAWSTMVIYEMDTEDLDWILNQIKTLARTPAMPMSDALDYVQSIRFNAVEAAPKIFPK